MRAAALWTALLAVSGAAGGPPTMEEVVAELGRLRAEVGHLRAEIAEVYLRGKGHKHSPRGHRQVQQKEAEPEEPLVVRKRTKQR